MARPAGPGQQKLKFKQSVTGVPTTELLKRLQTLHKELQSLDQESVDTSSLDAISKDLIAPGPLLGKDRGVKAFVACCLADLLRLYAPNAPYTANELSSIFQFFIRQLKYFTGPTCPNYQEYFYLIESLSNVKSACLMCDLPGADQLVINAFKQIFDLAKPELPKNIISSMADILAQLLGELPAIPSEVVDIILAQYLPKNVKANPSSLSMVIEVCATTADILQRYVAHYFSEVILGANVDFDDMSDEEDDGGKRGKKERASVADTKDFIMAHDLIKSIHRASPALLSTVIPQLEAELTAEDDKVRKLATKTLGDMFADRPLNRPGTLSMMSMAAITPAQSDLARSHPNTWKSWLGRSRDKIPAVRLIILESATDIIAARPELAKDIYDILHSKLVDPDEKVRAAACAAFQHVDYEAALHSFGLDLLQSLGERIQDRKHAVQKEALHSLSRLYNQAFGEISNGEEAAIRRFSWIPGEIFKSYLINDRELHTATEKAIHEYILPLPKRAEDESAWVDRLLLVMQYLDPQTSMKGLLRAMRLQERRPTVYERFLDACVEYNGGVIDKDAETKTKTLKLIARIVASSFPDPTKAETDLNKFARQNETRLYKLLRTPMETSADLKSILRAHAEATKRVEALSSGLVETFAIFMRRSGFLLLNTSSIRHLFKRLQAAGDAAMEGAEDYESQKQTAENARVLLETAAKHCPELFIPYIPELAKALLEETDDTLLQATLHAMSTLVVQKPDAFQRDAKVLGKAYEIALTGTSAQARFAATFVVKMPDNEEQAIDLVRELTETAPAASGVRLISQLNALKRIAKYAPEAFQTQETVLFPYLLGLLSQRSQQKRKAGSDDSMEDVKPNVRHEFADCIGDEDFLPEHQACILGLKILTNYVLARALAAQVAPDTSKAAGLFKVLNLILESVGRHPNLRSGPGVAGRLRLQAAISLLKLAQAAGLEKFVMRLFTQLAWSMQDIAFQVRGVIVHKLIQYCHARRLPSYKYNTLLFVPAHDPDPENMMMAQKFVSEKYKTLASEARLQQYDLHLVRLLHLIAHHPDFGTDPEDLHSASRYIEFFLDCIGTKENVSLLYYLAMKLKTVRDSESEEFSENLYVLSELAQHVIKSRAGVHSWPIQAHPGQVKMPGDIFKPLPSRDVALEIRKTAYISQETLNQLIELGKPAKADLKKVRQTNNGGERKRKTSPRAKVGSSAKRAKASNGTTATKAKKPRSTEDKKGKGKKKDEWSEDEDEEEDEQTTEDEEEEARQALEDDEAAAKAAEAKRTKGKKKGAKPNGNTSTGNESELTEQEEDDDDDAEEEQKERPTGLRPRPKSTAKAKK